MKKKYLYAATSIFCWSTVATITKLLLGKLTSIQVLWISSFLAAIFLLGAIIIGGNAKKLKSYKFKDYVKMALICFPGTFLYYIFYYGGADRLPASTAFIINYLWPVMCVVCACVILKEKVTARKCIAIGMSFVGVCVVAGGNFANMNLSSVIGIILCILGAVSYGVFTSLNQKYSYEKPIAMMISYFVTFLLTTVVNFINGDLFIPDGIQLAGFAWNGMFTMAVANTLWVLALKEGGTARISNLAYITPFVSLVWTLVVLGEPIKFTSVLGLVIIVAGILIQISDVNKTKPIDE